MGPGRRKLGIVLNDDADDPTEVAQTYMPRSDMEFVRAWAERKRLCMSQLIRMWLCERIEMEKARALFEAGDLLQGKRR